MKAPLRSGKISLPKVPDGTPAKGRVTQLRVGQCDGFIRLSTERQVYFHRADLREDTSFNALTVGDVVKFDLIEDAVSGARAIRVTRRMRAAKAVSR
jgi:cold shock CspA family protein